MKNKTEILNISPTISLPLDTVTQRIGIFGISGSGKTYTSSVLTEELLIAGAQIVVFDPLGVWWGLRATIDQVQNSVPIIYILGGDHADFPLHPSAGANIADVIVEEGLSAILDMSAMEQEQQAVFASSFARRLYSKNREPIHLMIDEADIFAPETPGSNYEWECRRIMDTVVRRGRVRGIGVSLISQRPAVIAKSLLAQTGTLIVHRLVSPQDQRSIEMWFKAHGGDEQRRLVMSSLATLPVGEAWLWSPSDLQLFERVKVRKRYTFDSSATPKVGVRRNAPGQLTPVNLSNLRERFSLVSERSDEDDPSTLRAKITELERRMKDRPIERIIEEKIIEKPVLTPEALRQLHEAIDTAVTLGKEIGNFHSLLNALVGQYQNHQDQPNLKDSLPKLSATKEIKQEPSKPVTLSTVIHQRKSETSLRRGEIRILNVLSRYPSQRLTPKQLASLVNLTASGGTWSVYVSRMKRNGWIQMDAEGFLQITSSGLDHIGIQTLPQPTSIEDVLVLWKAALRTKEYAILCYVIDSHPRPIPFLEIASYFDLVQSGGTFASYIGILRQNRLIIVKNKEISLSNELQKMIT